MTLLVPSWMFKMAYLCKTSDVDQGEGSLFLNVLERVVRESRTALVLRNFNLTRIGCAFEG